MACVCAQGPPPAHRKLSRFLCLVECTAADGSALTASVSGGCAGYEETARMVVEAALALAFEPHLCPGTATGGVLPPAVALGENLVRRLQAVGIRFDVHAEGGVPRARSFFADAAKLGAKL